MIQVLRKVSLILVISCFMITVILFVQVCAESPHLGKIKLWIGGDVHFGQAEKNPLKGLDKTLSGLVGIVNLEGPINDPGGAIIGNGELRLFNSFRSAEFLAESGVIAASVSNNHQNDAGVAGRKKTEEMLKGVGIFPISSEKSGIIDIDGFSVVVAAYDLTKGVAADLDAELKAEANKGDLLIVTFHVTGTPSYLPTPELKEAVNIALEAGARVVVSHGSHSVGPVERRGDSVIAWGLGNLIFNCNCTKEDEALLLQITIDLKSKKRPIAAACAIPIEAGLNGKQARLAIKSGGIIDLLEALGSSKITRQSDQACF